MSVPQELLELVERFNTNREAYRSGQYNETQLRREFIDPFFQLLGWDVNNKNGYAEAYKDVIHEDSIKIGGLTKAPDYCFRVGGVRKFFVETKRPSVNIKDDIDPAFQLRRYAWSAKLSLSILTDFEEFAVYDCRVKPNKADKASTARIMYVGNWGEFTQHWDEIASIFSREAVLKGSFDRYAESSKAKKGTSEVDTAFLKEIESWRDALARNLALRNPELSQHDLNFAVQRTIDRIIFLRICEDRGIERYGQLMALQNGDRMYERLCELFYRADERYNSGLFHFQKEKDRSESPDTLTPNLDIDDGALRDVIKNLYYPDSPYEFSVLSADILGQVYEQFLGKVIRLTAGHRAVVEEKPEVRKAGGVYYTPTYIVDYIVKNTVGKLVRAENFQPQRKAMPKEISKIRILDPACGSGSFLLGAYQYLLDWHRDWYIANDPEKWATGRSPALYQVADSNPQSLAGPSLQPEPNISVQSRTIEPAEKSPLGRGLRGGSQNPNSQIRNWQLTTAERRRILLNNIYGVDIDPQAVEVTKISLLIKVLEGESEQTIVKQLKMFHERALPDLGNNIKCGNSLIGPDFYQGKQMNLFDGDECYRINPFDWDKEFPEIMKNGGFDAVIGNPPYVDIKSLPEKNVKYIFSTYPSANNRINLFAAFIERSLALVQSSHFQYSMIVPTALLTQDSYKTLRHKILNNYQISKLVRLPNESFGASAGDVKVDTVIFVFKEKNPKEETLEIIGYDGYDRISQIDPSTAKVHANIRQITWTKTEDNIWSINKSEEEENVLRKCEQDSIPLEKCADFSLGLTPYDKYKGHTPEQIVNQVFHASFKKDDTFKKLLAGNDVLRYSIQWNGKQWISYGSWLGAPREQRFFTEKRILVKQIIDWTTKRIWATITEEELYNTQNAFNLLTRSSFSIEFLLGIINSRLMTFYHRKKFLDEFKMRFQKILIKDCRRLPIRNINFSNLNEKTRHDRMVELVKQMLELHKRLASAKTDHDKTVIHRQIDATDRQIDRLVYELYGLTEEEIKIVEEGSP
ncbi:MAG: TaqI-like C-terminal specificity domain-containing protein [Candidatus Brocadiales bacterium]|nr:TaqI-like C-terminal specificity domain-containing protein [Candidatus Brocadiales bacterium]